MNNKIFNQFFKTITKKRKKQEAVQNEMWESWMQIEHHYHAIHIKTKLVLGPIHARQMKRKMYDPKNLIVANLCYSRYNKRCEYHRLRKC